MMDRHRDTCGRAPTHRDDSVGPTVTEIGTALTELAEGSPTDIPSMKTARVLSKAEIVPVSVADRRVVELSITRGKPQHGEMRSDDHISDYVVEYQDECPECVAEAWLRHEYHAYHFIAGRMATTCKLCGYTLDRDEWG